jgi:Flp pilus assembly pilin Flp
MLGFYVKAQTLWAGLRDRMVREDGAVATEYALLLVLIAIAIVAAAYALGQAIVGKFTQAQTCLSTGSPC